MLVIPKLSGHHFGNDCELMLCFDSSALKIRVHRDCWVWGESATPCSKDANRLLVAPIENMIKFIKELAADPLAAAVQPRLMNLRRSESTNQILETDKIIISLYKITGLLKVSAVRAPAVEYLVKQTHPNNSVMAIGKFRR